MEHRPNGFFLRLIGEEEAGCADRERCLAGLPVQREYPKGRHLVRPRPFRSGFDRLPVDHVRALLTDHFFGRHHAIDLLYLLSRDFECPWRIVLLKLQLSATRPENQAL